MFKREISVKSLLLQHESICLQTNLALSQGEHKGNWSSNQGKEYLQRKHLFKHFWKEIWSSMRGQ